MAAPRRPRNVLLERMDSRAFDLTVRNRGPETIARYRRTLGLCSALQAEQGRPLTYAAVERDHVRDCLQHRMLRVPPFGFHDSKRSSSCSLCWSCGGAITILKEGFAC